MRISYIFKTMFLLFFILAETFAQSDVTLSRVKARPGETFSLTVTSGSTYFTSGGTSECPQKLNVSVSNVYLKQGSNSINSGKLSPVAVSAVEGAIKADFTLPESTPQESYDLVIGEGENCSIRVPFVFEVGYPYINMYPSKATVGDTVTVEIKSSEVLFDNIKPTSCSSVIHIKNDGILFSNGVDSFKSIEATADSNLIVAKVIVPNVAGGIYKAIVGVGEECPGFYNYFLIEPRTASLSPASAWKGKYVDVTINGGPITFSKTDSTICGQRLKVTASDVVFNSASGTTGGGRFSPDSITVSGNTIKAKIYMNAGNEFSELYKVTIGDVNACGLSVPEFFVAEARGLKIYPEVVTKGVPTLVTIEGIGYQFSETEVPNSLDTLWAGRNQVNFVRENVFSGIGIDSFQFAPDRLKMILTVNTDIPDGFINAAVGGGVIVTKQNAIYLKSQDDPRSVSVSPRSINRGEKLTVNISGNNVLFNQSTSTCNGHLKVVASEVVFMQSSGTATFKPNFISLNGNNSFNAEIEIPANTATGYYDLIVGEEQGCPVKTAIAFYVNSLIVPGPFEGGEPSLSVNPSSAKLGEKLTVNISGTNVSFNQSSGTCPSALNVAASDVIFRQSSGTVTFKPASISLNGNNSFDAQIEIPAGITPGYYNLIVGEEQGCPVTTWAAFWVTVPQVPVPHIEVVNTTIKAGTTADVTIYGKNLKFLNEGPSVCPGKLYVTASDILLKQGTSTIQIQANSAIVSDSVIQAKFSIPENAFEGEYNVFVGLGQSQSCLQISGAVVTITNQIPVVEVYPKSAYAGEYVYFAIDGTNISFSDTGSVDCSKVIGVDSSNVFLTDVAGSYRLQVKRLSVKAGDIYGVLEIPENTPAGKYDLVIGQGEHCTIFKPDAFYLQEPLSRSIEVFPGTIFKGTSVAVVLNGNNITFGNDGESICPSHLVVADSSVILKQRGADVEIKASSVFQRNDNSIAAMVAVPGETPTGIYDVVVNAVGCTFTVDSALTIQEGVIVPQVSILNQVITFGQMLDVNIYGLQYEADGRNAFVCSKDDILSSSNVVLKKGDKIYPAASISNAKSGSLESSFDLPSDAVSGEYELIVGYGEACSFTSRVDLSMVILGKTSEAATEAIAEIYPNPADGSMLMLKLGTSEEVAITITNQLGSEILNTKATGPVVDLAEKLNNNLSSGIYFVKVQDKNTNHLLKFIIR